MRKLRNKQSFSKVKDAYGGGKRVFIKENEKNNGSFLSFWGFGARRWEAAIGGIFLIIAIISLIIIVSALSPDKQTLQDELNNLTSSLDNSGYSWLINASINYSLINDASSIGVYEQNSNIEIARFDNISKGILQKKIRIDEIKQELKNG